jgi:small subunit ribosomal protein S17
MSKQKDQKNTENTNNGKILTGEVVSDKMQDTIVVRVLRYTKHPKYEKFIKIAKKTKAHDAGNTAKIGDKVKIAETTPISKDKRFKLIEIIK